MRSLYLIGSLRNSKIPEIAEHLRRTLDIEVFDDWHCVGPDCDSFWREYELARGHTYQEALAGYHARDVFEFDKRHIDRCDAVALVLPAGRSGHLELGYAIGRGKPGFILLDDDAPDRFDIMYLFSTRVVSRLDDLVLELRKLR